MAAYSLDLRERIVEAVERRIGSKRKIAEVFGVHESFIYKLLRQRAGAGGYSSAAAWRGGPREALRRPAATVARLGGGDAGRDPRGTARAR